MKIVATLSTGKVISDETDSAEWYIDQYYKSRIVKLEIDGEVWVEPTYEMVCLSLTKGIE